MAPSQYTEAFNISRESVPMKRYFLWLHISGLTEKTKISFTSSNSSYSECVRKHLKKSIPPNNSLSSSNKKSENSRTQITTSSQYTSGSSHSFTRTDFVSCKVTGDTHGGAIYCTCGSLTIEDCYFTNCQSAQRAGAVFFLCYYSCKDSNNVFVNSTSNTETGSFDDWFATPSVHSSSTYINSKAGGLNGIMNIEATADITVSSCIFINGSTPHSSGLLNLAKITGLAIISNSIFSKGSASSYGGGFGTFGDFTNNVRPRFSFCFFCNNVCSNNNRGADFDANGNVGSLFSKEQILHCFSSSPGLRIYIEGKSNSVVDNWMHQRYTDILQCR